MAKSKIPQELKDHFKHELADLREKLGGLCKTVQEIRSSGINIDLASYAILRSINREYCNVTLTTKEIRMVLKGIENIEEYLSDMSGWE